MVECPALEMRRTCKGIVGSNPTLSANKKGPLVGPFLLADGVRWTDPCSTKSPTGDFGREQSERSERQRGRKTAQGCFSQSHPVRHLAKKPHEIWSMGSRFDSTFSNIEVLRALGNYFKHQDEWKLSEWDAPTGLRAITIPVLKAAGLQASSTGTSEPARRLLVTVSIITRWFFRSLLMTGPSKSPPRRCPHLLVLLNNARNSAAQM